MPIILDPTGDPRDLTSLDAIRRLLQTPDDQTSQDPLLQDLITEASVMLQRELGRQFIPETAATKAFAYYGDGYLSTAPFDLRAVTAVEKDSDGTTPLDLEAGAWQLRAATGDGTYLGVNLSDYSSERLAVSAQQVVTITGDWGFEEVPPDVERGVKLIVKTWLRDDRRINENGEVFGYERVGRISQDILDGLAHYRMPVVG